MAKPKTYEDYMELDIEELKKCLRKTQLDFSDYYIELGNGTQAAIRAGYKKKNAGQTASENLKKPYIKAYIEKRMEKLTSERIAGATEVLEYLTAVMRGESKSEVVVVEGRGDGYSSAANVEKAPDEKERLKAAELIGKRYAIFTDRVQQEETVQVILVDDVPDYDEEEIDE